MSSPTAVKDGSVARSSEAPTVKSSAPEPPVSDGSRQKRNPSITPRKFRRFFTPRAQPPQLLGASYEASRRALFNVGASRRPSGQNVQSSPVPPPDFDEENAPPDFPRHLKRQKRSHNFDSSAEYSAYNLKHLSFAPAHPELNSESKSASKNEHIQSSPCERRNRAHLGTDGASDSDEEEAIDTPRPSRVIPKKLAKPIVRWDHNGGLSAQLFEMELGRARGPGGFRPNYPVNDWRDNTANFYSRPEDVHDVMSLGEVPRRTIPFVALGLNNSSLLAVGDEEGRVRLLESAKDGKPNFQQTFLDFRVHTNAIIDMTLSDDDSLLATASGDQSARVIDMGTQTTLAILGIHSASLKQVRFQPGANNKNVLATSGRDGSIQIWDLRCKGYDVPQCRMWTPLDEPRSRRSNRKSQNVLYPRPLNSIMDSHKPLPGQTQPSTAGKADLASRGEGGLSRSESLARVADVSVTCLQFLHEGLDNMLLSACEADASVKLWDIRAVSSKHRTLPISGTTLPAWHANYRDFGITSLNLSSNGSKFYALCKDNTVYAYRTSHLMLGHAPELEVSTNSRPTQARPTQEGLGPICGFRNPKFHANTFYVKSALRTTKNGHTEMLAVGSSDDCAVIFPTDDRYLATPYTSSHYIPAKQKEVFCLPVPNCPIYTIGTSLTRGHDREVGCVTWTHDGELATVGDDLTVRCWRENQAAAKDLRTGGEGEGRRWGCGWAEVNPDYDDDDEY